MNELKEDFSLDAFSKSPSVFDYEKLKWFNSKYIEALSEDEFFSHAAIILKTECPPNVNVRKLAQLLHTRVATFGEIEGQIEFVCKRLNLDIDVYSNKKNKTTPDICKEILVFALPVLRDVDSWSNDNLFATLKDIATKMERKAGAIMWAIRVAVARQAVTPGGATELMEVIGKEETIERIELAISELS